MEFFQRFVKPILRQSALVVLTFAVVGISLYARDFAKIRIGHLFILEAIAIIWIVITICTGEYPSWPEVWRYLWAPLIFFLYGLCLTGVDVYQIINRAAPLPSFRIAQHAILYIYPFLWMGIGWWTARQNRYYPIAVYGSLATALPNFAGLLGGNISLGPLLNLPWMQSLHRQFQHPKEQRLRRSSTLILLTIFACMPFWLMWLHYVQRTSFILFIVLIFLIPFALKHENETISRAIKIGLTGLMLYLGGQALTFISHSLTLTTSLIAIPKPVFNTTHEIPIALSPKPVPKRTISQSLHRAKSTTSRTIPVISTNSVTKPSAEDTHVQYTSAAVLPQTISLPVSVLPDHSPSLAKPLPPSLLSPPPSPPVTENVVVSSLPINVHKPQKTPPAKAKKRTPNLLELFSHEVRGPLMVNVNNAMLHGEDRPIPGRTKNFVMRTRRFMWKMAIHDWLQRPWIGMGFVSVVPSYVTPNLTNVVVAKIFERPPVAGPHNSYLSVLARDGVIGSIVFICILGAVFNGVYRFLRRSPLALGELILCFVPLNGLFYALLNSGFESPHNCFLLWLYSGVLIERANGGARDGRPNEGRGELGQGKRLGETTHV